MCVHAGLVAGSYVIPSPVSNLGAWPASMAGIVAIHALACSNSTFDFEPGFESSFESSSESASLPWHVTLATFL